MDFSEHLVISAAGSAAILAGGGDLASALSFSAVGVFMDLDHFPDYWRETGFNWDIPRFMSYFSTRNARHLWLFMHAWELIGISAVLAFLWENRPDWVLWGILGWFVHLLLDQRFNHLHKFAYFMFFRLKHGFRAENFYQD